MELKKSDKANLEKSRALFFEIGLLIALGFALLAFEWKVSPEEEEVLEGPVQVAIEEEIVPITRQDEPPPPPPEPPKITDILEIVADDVFVDTHVHIDIEVDLTTEITIYTATVSDFTEVALVEEEEEVLFHIVEDKPTFNGQDPDVAFRNWARDQINYPPVAAENGIAGRVIADFAIDRDGNIADIRIIRSIDPLLDNEIRRVLQLSPRWSPGMQRGRPVRVRYQFPFLFQLE